jgi:hypothetical protein
LAVAVAVGVAVGIGIPEAVGKAEDVGDGAVVVVADAAPHEARQRARIERMSS